MAVTMMNVRPVNVSVNYLIMAMRVVMRFQPFGVIMFVLVMVMGIFIVYMTMKDFFMIMEMRVALSA